MTPGWVEAALRRRWTWKDGGRDYSARRVDCHGFTIGAAREFFGVAVPDPLYASALDPRETALAVEFGRAGVVEVAREAVLEGDVVLVFRAGSWHSALYGGAGRILQMTLAGVSFPSILTGPLRGRVEGFYRVPV